MNHWGGPCHRADSDSAGRGGAWTCMSKQLPGDTAAAAGLQTPRGVQSCRPTDELDSRLRPQSSHASLQEGWGVGGVGGEAPAFRTRPAPAILDTRAAGTFY